MTIYSNILRSDGFFHSHVSRFLESAVGLNPYWILCYRASQHGWSSSTFHSLCDGKRNTVTIIRKQQYVFGGYTDIAWGKDTLKNNNNSFIYIPLKTFFILQYVQPLRTTKAAVYSTIFHSTFPLYVAFTQSMRNHMREYMREPKQRLLTQGIK